MNSQKHWHRKHKQLLNTDKNKDEVNRETETFCKLKDRASYSKISENNTPVARTLVSDHLTLYEIRVLQQKKSDQTLLTNKKNGFDHKADVISCEPSYTNQLTLHELFERQDTWKNKESALAQKEHFAHLDNMESASIYSNHLTLYELYQMQGFECNNQRKNVAQREFIPNPNNKEFYIQCRNKTIEKVPEWIKAIWKKRSNQEKCDGSKIARFSKKEIVEDGEQTNSGYHGHISKSIRQSCDIYQTASIGPECRVLEKSPVNSIKENRGREVASGSNVINKAKLSDRHENWLEKESVLSSTSDDVPLSHLADKERFSEEHILQRQKHKAENENNERFAVQITEAAASVVEEKSCENVDQENYAVQEWKEWSVKLLKDGQLCITGKCNGFLSVSEDVSHWQRIDARTLKNHKENIVYKLVGIPDHCVGTDFPSFIRKKFQNGFPKDWLAVLKLWNEMQHKGKNVQKNEQWTESNDSGLSDACAPSVQQHSACLSASQSHKALKTAKVMKKLEFRQPGDSSFWTPGESNRAGCDTQLQQPKLIEDRERIRGTTFPQNDQTSNQLKYTVTLRNIPDIQSSFDETDTSFF